MEAGRAEDSRAGKLVSTGLGHNKTKPVAGWNFAWETIGMLSFLDSPTGGTRKHFP